MKLNLPLLALAVGAFGIGVTEFAPMGMLPAIATDLGVSIPSAGLLISAYAFGVVIGAPLLILSTGKVPRRSLLIGLMAIFTLGNLLSALAPDYWTLMAARVVTSFNHGAFFGVGAVVAASVVAPDRRAGAIAAVFMGLTLANITGVPLAAWVGETIGWRVAFGGIAALGVITMIALRLTLPLGKVEAKADGSTIKAELKVLTRGPVLAALALTVLSASALFTVFTYISPILREQTLASTGYVTTMLMIFGVGMSIGNWLGGRYADASIDRTLITTLIAMAILLVGFAAVMSWQIPTAVVIFLWAIASFAIVAPLQMKVITAASEAPNLASAINIGAFNLGNAIGAVLGGAVINNNLGYPAVALAGAVMATSGLVMILTLNRREERQARSCPSSC